MLLLPSDIMALFVPFAPLFSSRIWRHIPVVVAGAILAPGRRMVSSVLRAVGLTQLPNYQTYHRVLNRAVWSSLSASRTLFGLLVATFAPAGPLVVGIDETIERRRGKRITAAGISRDPVRSSRSHFVTVRGRRWMCASLLVPIPWAARVWALPFLTVLAPSERAAKRRRRRFKPLTAWARQMIRQVHRWAPTRRRIVVGDRAYAALEVLAAVRSVATVVARPRLDARLFTPPPPARVPGRKGPAALGGPSPAQPHAARRRCGGRVDPAHDPALGRRAHPPHRGALADGGVVLDRLPAGADPLGAHPAPGDPLGHVATQALLCTDLDADPLHIVCWFILRWQLEVTFSLRGGRTWASRRGASGPSVPSSRVPHRPSWSWGSFPS